MRTLLPQAMLLYISLITMLLKISKYISEAASQARSIRELNIPIFRHTILPFGSTRKYFESIDFNYE